jgi:hypothetical protein
VLPRQPVGAPVHCTHGAQAESVEGLLTGVSSSRFKRSGAQQARLPANELDRAHRALPL